MIENNENDDSSSDPSNHEHIFSFLNQDVYQQDMVYIDVEPYQGRTEPYNNQDIFLTRSSTDQSGFINRYGGTQAEYGLRLSETTIIMSHLLFQCDGYLPDIVPLFTRYLSGYDRNHNPYGILQPVHTAIQDGRINLDNIMWTFTETPCEYFFTYLALHRHIIAFYARGCKNRQKFGRNRYRRHYAGDQSDTLLQTNIRQGPYTPTWNIYLSLHNKKKINKEIFCTCQIEKIPCGSLAGGILYNGCVNSGDYITLYSRMNELMTKLIVGKNLLPKRHFLEAVFEIQYLFIHLMPYDRGSLAVMNMFRFVMLAYYNRRQPDPEKRLPLAPTRTDAYPDLYAMMLCGSLEDFIEASFRDIYCVNYNLYCED